MSSRILSQTSSIGARLEQARTARGLTKRELARRANLSESYVGRIEKGARFPTGLAVDALARHVGVSRDWLLTGKGEMHPLQDAGARRSPVEDIRSGPFLDQLFRSRPDTAARLVRLLEPRGKGSLRQLPASYRERYHQRLRAIRARVGEKLAIRLDELVEEVERELADVRQRLLAEWRAHRTSDE